MNRLKFITLLFVAMLNVHSAYAQYKQELRAVWLTNVDSYAMFTDKGIADAMNFLADKGFNVVFPVVYNKGYTLYPSRVMDSLFQVPIISNFAGRDPLNRLVIEGHRNGLEVIPWFEFGFASSYSLNGGHIVAKFPSWAAKNNQGQLVVKNGFDWLSGINPDVQNYMLSLIGEVIDNYDVDGIQGDDRLPAMPVEGGYDSVTVAIYKSENGGANPPTTFDNNAWKRWRANKLNDYAKRMKSFIKAKGNYLLFSTAPSQYSWGYDNYLQDAKTWLDSNITENFIPQLYRQDYNSYSNELNVGLSYVPASKKNIFFAGVLSKVGSYVITPQLLLQSVALNRQKGVNGESFFFYESFTANNGLLGDTLKKTYYAQPALPPYRNGYNFRPKASVINEDSVSMTTRSGNWSKVPVQGFNPGVYWTDDSAYASFEYNFNVPKDAYYDVYFYGIPNTAFTQSAVYTLYGDTDSSKITVNWRDTKNSGWTLAGTVYLKEGRRRALKLDNSLFDPGKYVVADAAMIMINRKKSPDVLISKIDEEAAGLETPRDFTLGNNYPNPFNPETVIPFTLREAGKVKLKVYDLLGKEVAVLADGNFSAGVHEVKFLTSGKNIATGVYFYSLEQNGLRHTKKMTILK